MNRNIVPLILVLQTISCNAQDCYYSNKYYTKNINPTEWFDGINPKRLINLKGEIEELEHLTLMPDPSNDSELKINSGTNSYKIKFKKNGQIAEVKSLFGEINISTKYIDFYNSVISEQNHLDKNGELRRYEISNLSDNNVLIGKEIFDGTSTINENYLTNISNDTIFTQNRFYNLTYVNGNLICQIAISRSNKWIYEYHPNGKRKYKCSYENNLPEIEEKYNDLGLLVERKHFYYDTSGVVNEMSEYIHHYNGNLKIGTDEIYTINDNQHKVKLHYEYDEFNKLKTISRTSSNRKELISKVKYNENGDIQEITYENERTEYRNYKYDKMNNWIEREEWINGNFYYKYIREIKYRE